MALGSLASPDYAPELLPDGTFDYLSNPVWRISRCPGLSYNTGTALLIVSQADEAFSRTLSKYTSSDIVYY